MKKLSQVAYLLVTVLVVILDQSLKSYITTNFEIGQTKEVIPGLFSFYYLRNNGAAWNIFPGQMWLFYLITFIAGGFVLVYLFNPKYQNWIFRLGLALTLGGIIGNFLDRIRFHYVVDMIQLDFVHFNIFNVADSSITIGVGLIFIYLFFLEGKDEQKKPQGV